MILACNKLSTQCYDQQGEIEPLLDDAEKEIFAITGEHVKTEIVPTKILVMEAIEQIEKLYENRGSVTGLPTGFIELDRMTSGLHPAEMIVIAARPSMGKTALAMNIAEHVSIDVGKPVAVFSLEMSSQHTRAEASLLARQSRSAARQKWISLGTGFPESHFRSVAARRRKNVH